MKSHEDGAPELHTSEKKLHKHVLRVKCESSKNSVHSVNADEEQAQQTQSAVLAGHERAPLLKGLFDLNELSFLQRFDIQVRSGSHVVMRP